MDATTAALTIAFTAFLLRHREQVMHFSKAEIDAALAFSDGSQKLAVRKTHDGGLDVWLGGSTQ